MDVDANHRSQFAETGILTLRRLVPKAKTVAARDYLVAELERLKYRGGGKWHTKKLDGISPFQVAGKIAQGIRPHAVLDAVVPDDLVPLLTRLAGFKLRVAQPHPQVLVTPPQKEPWSLPTLGWHVDVALPERDVVPGIQVFVLVDDVAPRGGATMALLGSHHAHDLAPSPERVLEMHGTAGDVYVMDMRIRHAPSINATKAARLMLTNRYLNPGVSP